jgi:CheY-like chemotaxis protein
VLQNKPRILILDDLPEKGWVLSRILNSKDYYANSVTYPQNGIDRIEKERPDLLILDLAFSEASIIRILQKIRENNPSLPIFIYSDSVTEQFENQATKLRGCVFFPKGDVEQILD